MEINILYTPCSKRNRFNTNNSFNNLFYKSASQKVYKIKERLFSSNSLSLISSKKTKSKFNSNFNNFKSNYTSMIKNLITNDVDVNKNKKSGLNSLNNLFTNIMDLKNLSKTKKFFEQEKSNEKKEDKIPHFISYRKNKTINRNFFSEKKRKNKRRIFGEKLKQKQKDPLLKDNISEFDKIRLVNQVIKFDKEKNEKNNLEGLIRIKFGKNFDEFIAKKINVNYNHDSNSQNSLRRSTNFMTNNITNTLRKKISHNTKIIFEPQKKREKTQKLDYELIQEMQDKIDEEPIDLENIKNTLKTLFSDETKFNQVRKINEDFFDIFENKINFLYDCRRFPIIKNKLKTIKLDLKSVDNNEWTKLNSLQNYTLIFLNKKRVDIQRKLDEIEKMGNIDKKLKYKLYKDIGFSEEEIEKKDKLKSKDGIHFVDNNNSIDHIIKLMKNEIKYNNETNENEDEEKESKKEDIYEFEQFFGHNVRPYTTIDFANKKLSSIVYHNKKFYNLNSKRNSLLNK